MPDQHRRSLAKAAVVATVVALAGCSGPGRRGDTGSPRGDDGTPAPAPPVAAVEVIELGASPLCEASAMVAAPWDPAHVLVADNEVSDRLFAYTLAENGRLGRQTELRLPGADHPKDIEAMAVVGQEVLLVGSHGRNWRCQRRVGRERLEVVGWDKTGAQLVSLRTIHSEGRCTEMVDSVDACLDAIFVTPPPDRAAELCETIVAAAAQASAEDCIPPFDIEGAAAFPAAQGGITGRVWLGLRRPRLGGHPILLRLVPDLDQLRFDAVVLLAAGDRGVRSLAADEAFIYTILGPAAPDWNASQLWRAPRAALTPGATVTGEVVADHLPPSSEGLAITGGAAIIVTDGDEGENEDGPCETPALQLRVELD